MIDRSKLPNSFEFVVTAGARARQLLAGSTPRVTVGEHKKTTVAQQEVITRAVEKMEPNRRRNRESVISSLGHLVISDPLKWSPPMTQSMTRGPDYPMTRC